MKDFWPETPSLLGHFHSELNERLDSFSIGAQAHKMATRKVGLPVSSVVELR